MGKIKVYSKKKKQNEPEEAVIQKLQAKYDNINLEEIKSFKDFPLSSKTLKGLRDAGYHKPTDIQKQTLGLALNEKDILGAAQTGSGKTLAFLIPILEKLYVKQWTKMDGIGALVITPTRELAYQIFNTLCKIGSHHDFSGGLIIGGKDLKIERNLMDQCNIIICTPGRLLQHMDENPLFDCVNMQVLVLDEADRCLDMGFEQTMNAIIANLPLKRQTLLFSATQTKSVKDLARLSLKDPHYVNAHENQEFSTPKELEQSYIVTELKDKLSVLWSFLKNHPNKKIIVFFSSCKQVKYFFEIFSKLRPGTSLMALYGTLHQLRRMDIYETFCRKQSAILFATDLAARGLDFPAVNWVVQVDCPEDPETYIHRVGRTARYHRGGESLLMLLPSEIEMVDKLTEKKIPIQKIDINTTKIIDPVRKIEAYLAKDPSLKESAQRAFVSYVKAVFLMKNKSIFNVNSLDTNSFAHSLGLAIPPRIRFLQRMNAKKEANRKSIIDSDSNNAAKDYGTNDFENGTFDEGDEEEFPKENKDQASSKLFQVSDDEDSDDGIFKVKRVDHEISLPTEEEMQELNMNRKKSKTVTKAALAKKILKKNIVPNKKIIFSEEGEAIKTGLKEKQSELAIQYELENEDGIDIEKAKMVLKEEDKFDKQLFKAKVKAKHKEAKRKLNRKKQVKDDKDEFSESESEEEPDTSWLPDPDKLYGEKTEEEIENLESEIGLQVKPEKRKRKKETSKGENSTKPKKKKKLKTLSKSLSVNESEQLALMLLNTK